TIDPARPRPSIAVFDALDRLPIPLVVRARSGRLRFANATARDRLALRPEQLAVAGLTRFGVADRDGAAAFGLTSERTVERRIDARCARLPGDGDDPLDVLLLLPIDPDASVHGLEALARREEAVTRAWAAQDPSPTSALVERVVQLLADARTPRRLPLRLAIADLFRRLRRGAGRPVRLFARASRIGDGRARSLDAIAATELVLSAWELLTSGATGGTLRLSARVEADRLRFELDAGDVEGAELPDLRRRRLLLRSLRPALERLGAAFEVHVGGRTADHVVVTLPIRPAAG
ncbi:MAG: hypothetical protein ACF8XB_12205, partial [Planctomycetota bacterium JB042]